MRTNERGTGNFLYGVTPICLANETELHIRQSTEYFLPLPARPFHQPATTPIFSSCIVELIHLSACSSFAAYVHTDTYESRRPYEFDGLIRILFGFCLSLLNRQDLESLSFGHVSVSCGESSGRTGCASRKTQNK